MRSSLRQISETILDRSGFLLRALFDEGCYLCGACGFGCGAGDQRAVDVSGYGERAIVTECAVVSADDARVFGVRDGLAQWLVVAAIEQCAAA